MKMETLRSGQTFRLKSHSSSSCSAKTSPSSYSLLQQSSSSRSCSLFVQLTKLVIIIQLLSIHFHGSLAIDTSSCTNPLGMESYEIPDSDVTASSSFDTGNVGPQNARVRVEKQGGAWCPKNQVTSEAEEWLQIDLHTVQVITATETQGRFGNGQGQEYTEKYIVSYWRPELGKWVRYRDSSGNEILKANINTYLAVKTELSPPIIASKLRFLPYSLHRRTVCMRVEIYGCPFRDGLLSYTMPQGSKRGENWNFYDHTYDGFWEGNQLRNGLGLLVDGRGGPDNFKDDYYGHERGKGWVGWKNDSRAGNSPIEIIFKFDSVREFSAVNIHSSNQFMKDIQVFSEARITFSIGGKVYTDHDPISYITLEDRIFEAPKDIPINLLGRRGQYVKIQLFWAAKWILISEIKFDSKPAIGNFTDESDIGEGSVTTITTLASPIIVDDNSAAGSGAGGGGGGAPEQSDSSDGGNTNSRRASEHQHHETAAGSNTPGHPSIATSSSSHEWSTATIVMTAVISSFVAILMVLLFILTALVLRNRLASGNSKIGSSNSSGSSNTTTPHHHHHHHLLGTMPYEAHCEFGGAGNGGCYVTPGEIRKCKLATTTTTLGSHCSSNGSGGGGGGGGGHAEYQEPFANGTNIKCNPLATLTAASAPYPGANQTVIAATMKGKMVEYYSCTLVPNGSNGGGGCGLGGGGGANIIDNSTSNEYEYAVPNEFGKLLQPPQPPSQQQQQQLSPLKSIPNSPAIATRNRAIQHKFRELGIVEIPKHRLRMLRKLGDGAFGTVFIGEVENSNKNEKSLVAVKHLLRNATEKDKSDFLEEIRLLSSLNDPNVAQVLGVCTEEEPYSVILEFLELGDLCQFLRQNDTLLPSATKKLSSSNLIYLASQIASGMRFLESRNIVHRDLATRNCVIGHGLLVKISHFATDTDLYSSDYYRLDGKMPLPIRWMAWESLFLGKYSTKSDVWSFGITLWEILSYSRHSPYPTMTNQEVLANLRKLSICSDEDPFEPLPKPVGCPRDIYQLICDAWRRNDDDRPTFWEISSFLTRKSMSFQIPALFGGGGGGGSGNHHKSKSATTSNPKNNNNSNSSKSSSMLNNSTTLLNNNNSHRNNTNSAAPAAPNSGFPNSLPSSTTSTTTTASEQQYVI